MTIIEILLSFISIYKFDRCTLLHIPLIIVSVHLLDLILIFGAYGLDGIRYVLDGENIVEMYFRLLNGSSSVFSLRNFMK